MIPSPPTRPSHAALRDAAAAVARRARARAGAARPALAAHPASSPTPSPRSTRAPRTARRSSRCSRTLAPVLDGGIRLGDPYCVAHLHPAAADRRRRGRARGRRARTSRWTRSTPRRRRRSWRTRSSRWLARDARARPAGSGVMTMGGTASNLLGLLLARDRAGEDVRRDGLPPQRTGGSSPRAAVARQHPPLGRAARARHRGGDRRRDRRDAARCRSTALDARDRGRARDRHRRHGRARPTSARSTRSTRSPTARTQRGAWFHVDAAVGSGPDALRRASAPRLKGIERADSRHRRPAQAVVAAVRRQRAARARRRRACAPSTTRASTSTAPRTRPRASSTSSGARSTPRAASTR